MNICVYTIAKDEEHFVEAWAKSAEDADSRLILDTGSTDETVKAAKDCGVDVYTATIAPWRFDDARNASLALVSADADICIALDMDEVLLPGWRDALENMDPSVTRPRYTYTWSWNEDGSPGLQYQADKIHARRGYRWKHPVHEVLVPRIPEVQAAIDLEVHHFPDRLKSRGQYGPLLALAVQEDPYDDRNAHYYGRELMYQGRHKEAAQELRRHLGLPTAVWKPERAASMRYLAKVEPENALQWLNRATAEDPSRREGWVELAQLFYRCGEWEFCLIAAENALKITEKPLDYLCEGWAWGSLPYDLAAIAAYQVGEFEKARAYGEVALSFNPDDERLVKNLEHYRTASQSIAVL